MLNRNVSFASLAAIAAAVSAKATPQPNIVASGTVSNISLAGNGNLTLNIDGDAWNDFQITWNNSGFYISNADVSANGYITDVTVSTGYTVSNASAPLFTQDNLFDSQPDIMDVGFRFTSTDGIHYGWLEFDYTGADGVLTGAYYETQPNVGATVTAVPEPASGLAAAGLAGAAAIGFRQRRKKKA